MGGCWILFIGKNIIEREMFANFMFFLCVQFHVTAAGKEGANGGELEKQLSRAARTLWEQIHDQNPTSDNNRDKLTLDQFLDFWASLIDCVVKKGELPDNVQNLVNLGFELYSTKDDNKPAAIPPSSFEKLFQKMGINPPAALMAYQFLTEVCNYRVLDLFFFAFILI